MEALCQENCICCPDFPPDGRMTCVKDVSRHFEELWWESVREIGKENEILGNNNSLLIDWVHKSMNGRKERRETFKCSHLIQHKMTDLFAVICSSCLIFWLNVYAQLWFLTQGTFWPIILWIQEIFYCSL